MDPSEMDVVGSGSSFTRSSSSSYARNEHRGMSAGDPLYLLLQKVEIPLLRMTSNIIVWALGVQRKIVQMISERYGFDAFTRILQYKQWSELLVDLNELPPDEYALHQLDQLMIQLKETLSAVEYNASSVIVEYNYGLRQGHITFAQEDNRRGTTNRLMEYQFMIEQLRDPERNKRARMDGAASLGPTTPPQLPPKDPFLPQYTHTTKNLPSAFLDSIFRVISEFLGRYEDLLRRVNQDSIVYDLSLGTIKPKSASASNKSRLSRDFAFSPIEDVRNVLQILVSHIPARFASGMGGYNLETLYNLNARRIQKFDWTIPAPNPDRKYVHLHRAMRIGIDEGGVASTSSSGDGEEMKRMRYEADDDGLNAGLVAVFCKHNPIPDSSSMRDDTQVDDVLSSSISQELINYYSLVAIIRSLSGDPNYSFVNKRQNPNPPVRYSKVHTASVQLMETDPQTGQQSVRSVSDVRVEQFDPAYGDFV
jgi:hypothetical protein